MRSLWTSASGLTSQQARIDSISHNIANLNTTGYKKQDVQFKDMLYAELTQRPDARNIDQQRLTEPGLRIGHGVLVSRIGNTFTQGSIKPTDVPTDVAIEGEGFFNVGVMTPEGMQKALTRDGSFNIAIDLSGTSYLVDKNAMPVLDIYDQPINLTGVDLSTMNIDPKGRITARIEGVETEVAQLQVVRVEHPEANLRPSGDNLYFVSPDIAPDQITVQAYNQPGGISAVRHKALEQSNVDLAAQMSELIMAQRAYSMNSRALQTADQMMGIANNIRNG